MRFQGNINWETAKTKFQDFLHRHLNIDRSSIIIEGIVSNNRTWYIMEGTSALMEALDDMVQVSLNNNGTNELENPEIVYGLVVAILVGVCFGVFRYLR